MHETDTLLARLHEEPTTTILALCRIYCRAVTGDEVGEDVAVAWAHARFPHVGLARARAIYLGGLPDDYAGIDLDYVGANLRALIAQQDRA